MSFLNMTRQDLIDDLGAPLREMDDGRDGYILVFSGDGVFEYNANKFGGSVPELQCYMDNAGYCYDVKTTNTRTSGISAGKTIVFVIVLVGILGLL